MANNNCIKCRSGKTVLVDPNNFEGQNSFDNISVPLEDLNIIVQLSASKKSRTILTTEKSGNRVINSGGNTDRLTVNFIEGSDVSGKRVLTTEYTDLTTSFDSGNTDETLGITNIDIDFSSAMAPQITINFIDVRGSSIFQNDKYINNGQNKYSVFFQLPYPLFELTIKGYYGKPVKYCLHLTKFNSKFNSQTGNFEITANFIGYTYAMLSDMLLGYLKAIPYTQLGKAKFEKLRQEQPEGKILLTIDELMEKISGINILVDKLKANDPVSLEINAGKTQKEFLSNIKSSLNTLGSSLDFIDNLETYPFILVLQPQPTTNQFNSLPIQNGVSLPVFFNNNISQDEKQKEDRYKDEVTTTIERYNGNVASNTTFKLDVSDFTTLNKYENLTIDIINNISELSLRFQNGENIGKTREELLEAFKKHNITSNKQLVTVYDLRKQYDKVLESEKNIEAQLKKLTKTLGEIMKQKIVGELEFDPTIRNIINILTTHVEVFLSVIYDVSASAANQNNKARIDQLKLFKNDYDYKNDAVGQTTNTDVGSLNDIYYPWPEYRKEDQTSGLVEKYLGDADVLQRPQDVDELNFINDLLKAILESDKRTSDIGNKIGEAQTNWFPINPMDSRLFINTFPYKRINGRTREEVIVDMMIRASTYLGYSNVGLTSEEIIAMANVEADAVIKDISEDRVLSNFTLVRESDFIEAKAKVNGSESKVIASDSSGNYYYNFIFDGTSSTKTYRVIPLTNLPVGTIDTSSIIEDAKFGDIFLTNYTTSLSDKTDNGGKYITIMSIDDYNEKVKTLTEGPSSNNVLNLEKLQSKNIPLDGSGVGFNQFGGKYGYQEFTELNYGDEKLKNLPFRFVFYDNSSFGNITYNKCNGLGYVRTISGKEGGKNSTTTPFDLNRPTFQVPRTIQYVQNYIDGSNATHASYGLNRVLSNELVSGSNEISYPYINFYVFDNRSAPNGVTDGSYLAPVSLFGSRFYYEQKTDLSKAFLFLHSFPWAGLTTRDFNLFTIEDSTIFGYNAIKNSFSNRAGFISAPKLWAAFIGGLLWRLDIRDPKLDDVGVQIGGGSGPIDPIVFQDSTSSFIPTLKLNDIYPSRDEYMSQVESNSTNLGKRAPDSPLSFRSASESGIYKKLDNMLVYLPEQAKDEFKKVFFDFVNKKDIGGASDWDKVKSQLEISSQSGAAWISTYNNIISSITPNTDVLNKVTVEGLLGNNKNISNYIVLTPLLDSDNVYVNNYILELKDGTQAMNTILSLYKDEVIIANSTFRIWLGNNITDVDTHSNISISKNSMDLYVKTLVDKFTSNKHNLNEESKKKDAEQSIFGTTDENLIKFNLYKTIKNIYDKWVGGSDDDDIIFQCGGRNTTDKELAIKRGVSSPKLIDSFRFVTRSFKDIGDDLIINPLPLNDYLIKNINTSFYEVVGSLLSANNFDFIPLPSYINYNDNKELESIFEPYPYKDAMSESIAGPSFVCVYVGQTSKNLDFNNSNYPNDGFDIKCDKNGNLISGKNGLPKDFSSDLSPGENNVAVFAVNYGQQNQNIFKDVTLDQSEFTETAESLQIQDDIANKGAESNRSFVGQNIYNVYSIRSYKAEVEMMGNAMIQPMMYFQLNNIPMFHGAYMITRVKHSIKPNFMLTNFTGVRIRSVETPLVEIGVLYMNLLDSMTGEDIGVGTGGTPRSVPFGNSNNSVSVIVPISDLKDRINSNKFELYKNTKFTQYGIN